MTRRSLTVTAECWPIAGRFALSRGTKTIAETVLVEITEGVFRGRGESVPYARFSESVESVIGLISMLAPEIGALDRHALQTVLPPGAARNAVDCALIDLEAKIADRPAHDILGLPAPKPVTTAFTISLDSPKAMGEAAAKAMDRPLLKIKLGANDAIECVAAVRAAAPGATLIADANEAWTLDGLCALAPELHRFGVALIEQPLRASEDSALAFYDGPVPLCADESLHSRAELSRIAGLYRSINVKLDKTGGLTEAVALCNEAKTLGLDIVVGCMVSTSLAMAPAALLASYAAYVDLDGPLLLERDREDAIAYRGSLMAPAAPRLWG